MLEQLSGCLAQLGCRAGTGAGSLFQPGANLGPGQVKHQIVGAQAGNVQLCVEALERIVEIVGQKDRFDSRLCGKHLPGPITPGAFSPPPRRTATPNFPRVTRSPLKAE